MSKDGSRRHHILLRLPISCIQIVMIDVKGLKENITWPLKRYLRTPKFSFSKFDVNADASGFPRLFAFSERTPASAKHSPGRYHDRPAPVQSLLLEACDDLEAIFSVTVVSVSMNFQDTVFKGCLLTSLLCGISSALTVPIDDTASISCDLGELDVWTIRILELRIAWGGGELSGTDMGETTSRGGGGATGPSPGGGGDGAEDGEP